MFPIVPPIIWKLFQNEVDKSKETKVGCKESSKTDGKKPKRNREGGLKMTAHNVYSRAYHKCYCKTGDKLEARKAGQAARIEWSKTL